MLSVLFYLGGGCRFRISPVVPPPLHSLCVRARVLPSARAVSTPATVRNTQRVPSPSAHPSLGSAQCQTRARSARLRLSWSSFMREEDGSVSRQRSNVMTGIELARKFFPVLRRRLKSVCLCLETLDRGSPSPPPRCEPCLLTRSTFAVLQETHSVPAPGRFHSDADNENRCQG